LHNDTGIELSEDFIEPGASAKNRRLACDHACLARCVGGNELSGKVPYADVFRERELHLLGDAGGQ
jgi:hypothetical protein